MTNQMTRANNSNADSLDRGFRLPPCLAFASNSLGSKQNPQSQCKAEFELNKPQFGHFIGRAPFLGNNIRNLRPFKIRLEVSESRGLEETGGAGRFTLYPP